MIDDPKKSKMLGELAGLAQRVASGRYTPKQVERALKLEKDIPWPHERIGSLVKQSATLTRIETKLTKVTALRKKLQAKTGHGCSNCSKVFRTVQGLGLHFHHAQRNGGVCR